MYNHRYKSVGVLFIVLLLSFRVLHSRWGRAEAIIHHQKHHGGVEESWCKLGNIGDQRHTASWEATKKPADKSEEQAVPSPVPGNFVI